MKILLEATYKISILDTIKNDATISNICPQKWVKNGRIEWPGPYYYIKNTECILKYENFIVQKLRVIDSGDIR